MEKKPRAVASVQAESKRATARALSIALLRVEECFFLEEGRFGFDVVFVGNTAIDRTNLGTLGLCVKALALGAFVRDDVVVIKTDGLLGLFGFGGHP